MQENKVCVFSSQHSV